MNLKLAKIKFCFPGFFGKNKEAFIDALVNCIRLNNKIGYAGYYPKKYLLEAIRHRFSDSDVKYYKLLSKIKKQKIKKSILQIIEKCHKKLPLRTLPIYIFVFPWVGPFDKDDKIMEYVTGFAPYKNTIHIFLSPEMFSQESLKQTVAHEYNHALSLFYHQEQQTILETLIFEGIAENFEEEIVAHGAAPYATVLTKHKAKRVFNSFTSSILKSKKHNLYREIFFGGKRYEKWSGYSIGYWIVKSFRKIHPNIDWKEIIKMDYQIIVDKSFFVKK